MGRRDRAVQPGGRAADASGTDRRRPAGVGCHAGAPGPDAAAGLAGLPLDARTVPAVRPDRGTVPDRPAGGWSAAVLCRDRRHAGTPVFGPVSRSASTTRPTP